MKIMLVDNNTLIRIFKAYQIAKRDWRTRQRGDTWHSKSDLRSVILNLIIYGIEGKVVKKTYKGFYILKYKKSFFLEYKIISDTYPLTPTHLNFSSILPQFPICLPILRNSKLLIL